MAEMAILFQVDRCARCRGCQAACARINKLPSVSNGEKVTVEDWMVVKSDVVAYDMPPYVRYSCWQCTNPPCAPRCPFNAISKRESGAVVIDQKLCRPFTGPCFGQCRIYCGRGGYPKIGSGNDSWTLEGGGTWSTGRSDPGSGYDGGYYNAYKAWKCHMCYPWIKAGQITQPACVSTCPANALSYELKTTVLSTVATYKYSAGDGSVYWVSNKQSFLPPKADPLIEDHISPVVGRLLNSPAGKAVVAPALLIGGLYALYQRRLSEEK